MTLNKIKQNAIGNGSSYDSDEIVARGKHVNPIVDKVNTISPTATSLVADTISESTSATGVTVDGVLLKDSAVTGLRKVVSVTADATYAITAAQTGTLFLLNKADGITFTLPTAAVGLEYEFFVPTAVTSNNYGIDTDGTDNFEGIVLNVDKDQTYSSTEALQIICVAEGTPTHIDMNGGTSGGLIGSRIRVTATTTDRWLVEGIIKGDGNLVTIFS